MPPGQLPWDRKDFFEERKNGKASSELLGPSSFSRWRDNGGPHHSGLSRWSPTDFRRPSGHGKQGGGWHTFSEETGSCGGGDVKYARRENKVAFSGQKEWKGHSLETTASPNGNFHPHSDFVNSWDQLHSKEHDDKNSGVSNTGQKLERENSLGLNDWKPLKWTRSGSLSSRGSGFSHSSSSKSMGVDSVEMKVDVQLNNEIPLLSPSGDATGCVTSGAHAEDNCSRKKPRLGWGEGLAKYEKKKVDSPNEAAPKEIAPAKYEKKKVDGPDEAASKEIAGTDHAAKDAMDDGASNLETLHSNHVNVMEKSPRLAGISECASPATPSSVACSSSPGIKEKSCSKTSSFHNGVCNPSSSTFHVSMNHSEGLAFNLENLDLTEFANLSSSLTELLQSDDLSLVDSGFVRSTAMNKLLVWKANISKTLEVTESDIDSLENKLKLLVPDSGLSCPLPAASTSLLAECKLKPSEEQCATPNVVSRPSPLNVLSGCLFSGKIQDVHEEVRAELKDDDIDSPGSATSNFVEPLSLRRDVVSSDSMRQSDCLMNPSLKSENSEVKHSVSGANEGKSGVIYPMGDGSQFTTCTSSGTDAVISHREDMVYDTILASNKDFANRASEVFSKLLPTNEMCSHISRIASVPCSQNELQVRENFAKKKRSIRFKERFVTLKFKAFLHLWKEDLRLLSIRRNRAKAQKKYDLSSRIVNNGYQKHRSSIRSRFSSPAVTLSLVPTSEINSYMSKLLSDSRVKIYRDTLKMPSLILEKDRRVSRFISDNGLVEDPYAIEKERSMVNPWTPQEADIFLNKLATFGKDFNKIASFLDHKTTADCVEFYYKNHKSDSFQKIKKKSEHSRQAKSYSTNTYLVTSGKRWNRESNSASLDMLGAVSEIAANADDCLDNQHKFTSRFFLGTSREYKKPRGDDVIPERASSLDVFGNERETAAADVLAGICGSISSEAMSSCITSSIDPCGEGYPKDWKCKKADSSLKRRRVNPEVTQNVVVDETCSDESCGEELDASDWTDKEKSLFIQAVASYGKDFALISSCMKTRSRDQCKVFFSKARKCLGLDVIHPEPCRAEIAGANGGHRSDGEDVCLVENKVSPCCKTEEQELQLSELKLEHGNSATEEMNLQPDLNQSEDKKGVELMSDDLVPNDSVVEENPKIDIVIVSNTENGTSDLVNEFDRANEDQKLNEAQESEDSANWEEVASVEERNCDCLPSTSDVEVKKEAIEKLSSIECSEGKLMTDKLLLPEASLGSTLSEVNGKVICTEGDSDSAGNRVSSLGQSIDLSVAMELDTAQKPSVISLDNCSQASNSSPQNSIVVHHRKALSHDDTSSKLDFRKSNDRRRRQKAASTDGYLQHLPVNSLLDCVESSQILRGYPVTVSKKNGINGDVGPNVSASSMQSVPNLDRNNFHVNRHMSQENFLKKCNGSRHNGLMSELPFQSGEQKQSSPFEVDKPCRNGELKLFGQILSHPSSPQSKPSFSSSSTHETEEKGTHYSRLNKGQSFNLKFGDNNLNNIDKNSFLPKYEQNNYSSSAVENNHSLPLRSYGYWDGNRIQTGLPSLPDSAILLAKYPAAFGNIPTPTSKIESHPLNGGVFPSSSSSSRVLPDYQMYRSRDFTKGVQPFTVDQLRKDFLNQVQGRKEIELLSSSIQHQGRRNVAGLNIGGGREGLCNNGGISDPVVAIKMHYSKTEQYRGNIRKDEPWRGSSR